MHICATNSYNAHFSFSCSLICLIVHLDCRGSDVPEDAACNPHPHQTHFWETALSSPAGLKCGSSLEHQFKTWLTLVVPCCSMSPFSGASVPEETPLITILFSHKDGSLISCLLDLKGWAMHSNQQALEQFYEFLMKHIRVRPSDGPHLEEPLTALCLHDWENIIKELQ